MKKEWIGEFLFGFWIRILGLFILCSYDIKVDKCLLTRKGYEIGYIYEKRKQGSRSWFGDLIRKYSRDYNENFFKKKNL